ncbi:MAG: Crp/Fnr family transcriptional regulator [Nitrospirales bacterium]|nr:MAG: Crp/Fnr family transcriptional regulator [Nitrospirales bacterium]
MYQPGQFVFYEGHPVLALYILCSGRVKLSRLTKNGQCRLVSIVDPGELIETQSFQDGAVHALSCESLEPSQVCIIDRTRYLALLEQNGELAVRVIRLLSRKMSASFNDTDQFAFASARERIAGLLLELVERYGEQTQDGTKISLHLKREELAQMAAVSVETAVRILQTLQSTHLIQINGREITVLDPDRLVRAARKIATTISRSS